MRSRNGIRALALVALLLAGCASSGKLARKSQEQLEDGDPRKAYATALKAVAKNPYDATAVAALSASSRAVLAQDARRFTSLLAARDSTAAAEVALAMDAMRHAVAGYGVDAAPEPSLAAAERAARRAAARAAAREGDARFDAGRPKPACASYAEARRFEPENAAWAAKFEEAHAEATDRVLLLPYACDTRARVDARALSDDMAASLARFAEERLEFTELAEAGPVWNRLFRAGGAGGGVTREAAAVIGQEREATRVAWSRIHGDRIESFAEVRDETLYRRVRTRQPDGTTAAAWEAVPVRVRVEDRWVSVALECEVWAIAERRIVARRTTDHGAGLRLVSVVSPLAGEAGDWALWTPEQWAADRAGCEARAAAWKEAYGTLSADGLAGCSRADVPRRGTSPFAVRYGRATRLERGYDVCYGRPAGEGALLQAALAGAWRELAAVLEESDRS